MSRVVNKEWMSVRDRSTPAYMNGVEEFINFAVENDTLKLPTMFCPCFKCKNKIRHPAGDIRKHLIRNGVIKSYPTWYLHGERTSVNRTTLLNQVREEEVIPPVENDVGIGMENLVDAAYGVHEDSSINNQGDETSTQGQSTGNEKYDEYKRLAVEKLYPSCEGPETTLSAIVELHNLKKQYGWSGHSVTALLVVLKKWLPRGNTLPEKYPRMKCLIKDLGMKASFIHACTNNCILYRKEHAELGSCPQCGENRYVVNHTKSGSIRKEPRKVLRHFPIIPRLLRFYTIPWIAEAFTWHGQASRSEDYQRHPSDSVEWSMFSRRWPNFAREKRNVWLGIATDGFNPRGIQSSSYSCWPVITIPYNLPPSLCMKKEFQMLSLLIPGPKAPGQDIDVFLQPLIEEMKILWEEGVAAYDMHAKEQFTLKAMLLWGIHDFPAYGNLSGSVTHGYKACPVCVDNTPSIRQRNCHKIVYTNYRLFLNPGHPFRDGGALGLKTVEYGEIPPRLCGDALYEKLSEFNFVLGKVHKESSKKRKADDAVNMEEVKEAWYKKSILFDLEYWKYLQVRFILDVMHTEKNTTEHLLSTILDDKNKSKDTINARKDMQEMGIHSGQWMTINESTGKEVKPKASFVLDKTEKQHFCQILKDLKLPSSFSSNLSNIVTVNPPGLHTMKSHDYHVIMEYLLPVLLQHAFPNHRDLKRAIQQLSLYFKIICSKVLIRKDVLRAKHMVVEALCVLEKHFPPAFFDISIHLIIHLADEALLCGPTSCRWMYPIERDMKDFKGIHSNKRYVEGSIAESYIVAEAVRHCMEYMPNALDGNHKRTREAFLNEDGDVSDEGPLLEGKDVILEAHQFQQIRRWILFRLHVDELDEYYSECKLHLATDRKGKGKKLSTVEEQTYFISWAYKKIIELKETESKPLLWRLLQGPMHKVKTFKKYRINGFVFSPKYHDETVCTQDSGVYIKAVTEFRARKSDKNLKEASIMYYGVIRQIIEVDYTVFKEVVFYCDWVRVEDKVNGCKLCPHSNLVVVNLEKLKSIGRDSDEPVILASEASQVFYSRDLKNPNWWVVIHPSKRMTSRVDELDVPEVFQSILEEQPHLEDLLTVLT